MYDKKTDRDLLGAAANAALGAGVITSFAVARGQHPLMGLAITLIAVIFAVACRKADLI